MGAGQSTRSLPQARRIVGSGDKNDSIFSPTQGSMGDCNVWITDRIKIVRH